MQWAHSESTPQADQSTAPRDSAHLEIAPAGPSTRTILSGVGDLLIGPGLWIEALHTPTAASGGIGHIATHRITATRVPGRFKLARPRLN
ncbi:MAG: hypothetical protein AAGK04_07420 [Planctomycetota bacterium]